MEKVLNEARDFVTRIREDRGNLLYEDYGTEISHTGFRMYVKIEGCKMIIYVNKFSWGGLGIEEYDYGLKDISVKRFKQNLSAESDSELLQRMKERFGVRDGDRLLKTFMEDLHISYKTWSD